MLKKALLVIPSVIFFIFIVCNTPLCPNDYDPINKSDAAHSQKDNKHECPTIGSVFLAQADNIALTHDKEITSLSTLGIFLFTIILAIAGGLQYCAVMASVREARRASTTQAILTRRSIKIAERALTELEAPSVFVRLTEAGIRAIQYADGSSIKYRYELGNVGYALVNYGRSPATMGKSRSLTLRSRESTLRLSRSIQRRRQQRGIGKSIRRCQPS
jgi:hypothetical protein